MDFGRPYICYILHVENYPSPFFFQIFYAHAVMVILLILLRIIRFLFPFDGDVYVRKTFFVLLVEDMVSW